MASCVEEPPVSDFPHPVTNPRRIPSARYYDEEFFRLENQHVWPRVWQMACRLEEIPEIGDWVEYKILEDSIIVVRAPSGIRAFHNACRHRGVRLAQGKGNCARGGFVCPFHGWRWNMEGENAFVFGRTKFDEADLDKADIALVPCRVELWGGCAFINQSDDAPPLLKSLGLGAARMDARNIKELNVDWWHSTVLPVNWKLALEAFMEGLHVAATHPQLRAASPPESHRRFGPAGPESAASSDSASARAYVAKMIDHAIILHEGMSGMVVPFELEIAKSLHDMELSDDIATASKAYYTRLRDEITKQGRAKGLPVPDLNQIAGNVPFRAVEYFFPNYFLLPLYSGAASYRIRPLTAETCLFEMWSMAFLPEEERKRPLIAPTPMPCDDPSIPEIPRQDYSNLPRQQLGLHAKGFDFMRLSPEVEGTISNYHRLIDGYLSGVPIGDLTKAAQLVSGGFESPIIEIWI